MTFPTRRVTLTLRTLSGDPCVGVTVRARLNRDDTYQGSTVAATLNHSVTNSSGVVTFDLFPNHPQTGLGKTGSTYKFWASLGGGETFHATAQIPDADCNLTDVQDLPTVPGVSAAVAAQGSAQAYAVTASAAAVTAQEIADTFSGPSAATLIGYSRGLPHSASGRSIADFANGHAINLFEFLTPPEITDYINGGGEFDFATPLANAVSDLVAEFGERAALFLPPGEALLSNLVIPACAGLSIIGVPGRSIIKATPDKPLTTDLIETITGSTRAVQKLRIQGVIFDGNSIAPQRWLQDSDGNTITDPQNDYYAFNSSGKIGNPAFPSWTIDDTVAQGRRNPNYTQVSSLLKLQLVDGLEVFDVGLRNHYGPGLSEGGSKDAYIERIWLNRIGKNDGPYRGITTQSFGTPGGGQPNYKASENINISWVRARDLERSVVAFMPTGGGSLTHVYGDGFGESGAYIDDTLNYDGGHAYVDHIQLKNGVITDIVNWGFEAWSTNNLTLGDHIWLENIQGGAMAFAGATRFKAYRATTKNVCTGYTYPFGPFSERYAFNRGTSPVAGTTVAITDQALFFVGSAGSNGGGGSEMRDIEVLQDTRGGGDYPYIYRQTKTGSDKIAGSLLIEGGSIEGVPDAMKAKFLDKSTSNVWLDNMPLAIRNVRGHASAETVHVFRIFTQGTTSNATIVCGFRPRKVTVYVTDRTDPASGRFAIGAFSWNAAATRNDFSMSHASDASGRYDKINTTDVIRLTDSSGPTSGTKFLAEFIGWKEDGFTLNVISAIDGLDVEFVCDP
jgi:hypothetical protein